jgi:hypothetical protein
MPEAGPDAIMRSWKGVMSLTTHVIHHHRLHWPRAHARLVVAFAVALLLMIAVAAGVLIGRSTKTSAAPVEGLASEKAVSVVDESLAALNRGDWKTFGAYWAKDAVLEEPTKETFWEGRQAIVAGNQVVYHLGGRMFRDGPVIQVGDMAAYAVRGHMGGDEVSADVAELTWIDLVKFDTSYRIQHLWSGFDAGPVPTG